MFLGLQPTSRICTPAQSMSAEQAGTVTSKSGLPTLGGGALLSKHISLHSSPNWGGEHTPLLRAENHSSNPHLGSFSRLAPKHAGNLFSQVPQVVVPAPLHPAEPADQAPRGRPPTPAPWPRAQQPGTLWGLACARRVSVGASLSGVNINQELLRSRTALKVPLGTILPRLRDLGSVTLERQTGRQARLKRGAPNPVVG